VVEESICRQSLIISIPCLLSTRCTAIVRPSPNTGRGGGGGGGEVVVLFLLFF
jgi:hypothetical protein